MRKQFLFLCFFIPLLLFASESTVKNDASGDMGETTVVIDDNADEKDCKCKGIPLKGKVKVVDSFADLKVKVVDSFADIHVKKVRSFPDKCGEWQFVEAFPDFTITFVDAFPDVKVKFVDSFPGMK